MIDQPSFIDSATWPNQLDAHVVDQERGLIFGYSIDQDLSCLPLGALQYLALTGELPTREQLRIFEVAVWSLSRLGPAAAPVHAAILSQLVGATDAAIHAVAAMGVAEWASEIVVRHTPLSLAPASLGAFADDSDDAQLFRHALRSSLGDAFKATHLTKNVAMTRQAHIVALFRDAGLSDSQQIARAFASGVLPVVLAEAFAAKFGQFMKYPVNVPPMVPDDD